MGLTVLSFIFLLSACSVDDGDSYDAMIENSFNQQYAVYNGEWTVNKEVIDTARLEVTSVLRVRLPEFYLGVCCFEKEYSSSSMPVRIIEYKGQPAIIPLNYVGYTTSATFNSLSPGEKNYDGRILFSNAAFYVAIDGVDHRVEVLSDEPGSAVYNYDNDLWTIGFTVTAFCVTNMATNEQEMHTPHTPQTFYYSTRQRIR